MQCAYSLRAELYASDRRWFFVRARSHFNLEVIQRENDKMCGAGSGLCDSLLIDLMRFIAVFVWALMNHNDI